MCPATCCRDTYYYAWLPFVWRASLTCRRYSTSPQKSSLLFNIRRTTTSRSLNQIGIHVGLSKVERNLSMCRAQSRGAINFSTDSTPIPRTHTKTTISATLGCTLASCAAPPALIVRAFHLRGDLWAVCVPGTGRQPLTWNRFTVHTPSSATSQCSSDRYVPARWWFYSIWIAFGAGFWDCYCSYLGIFENKLASIRIGWI